MIEMVKSIGSNDESDKNSVNSSISAHGRSDSLCNLNISNGSDGNDDDII